MIHVDNNKTQTQSLPTVPEASQEWARFTKVSDGVIKYPLFRIDPDEGQILYESKKKKGIKISPYNFSSSLVSVRSHELIS